MHVCFADYYLSRHIDRREVSVWLHRLLGNLKADKQFRITGGRIGLKERTRDVVPDKPGVCATSSHWNFWPDDLRLCCEQEICMWTCQSGHYAFGAQPWHSEVKREVNGWLPDWQWGVLFWHQLRLSHPDESRTEPVGHVPNSRAFPACRPRSVSDGASRQPAALSSVFQTCRRWQEMRRELRWGGGR